MQFFKVCRWQGLTTRAAGAGRKSRVDEDAKTISTFGFFRLRRIDGAVSVQVAGDRHRRVAQRIVSTQIFCAVHVGAAAQPSHATNHAIATAADQLSGVGGGTPGSPGVEFVKPPAALIELGPEGHGLPGILREISVEGSERGAKPGAAGPKRGRWRILIDLNEKDFAFTGWPKLLLSQDRLGLPSSAETSVVEAF